MRVSQRNRSRSRSKENRENRSPHRRSSPEEADDRENQGERESDENEENDDPHRNNRTTRPPPRTTPITVSPAAPPFTTTLTNNPRAPGNTSSSSSSTRTRRASGRPTTRISTTTSSVMSVTSTAMQRIEPSATTFAPQPGSTSSNKVTITVLAVVAGLVFFIVILLALCLAWRKWCQSRPPADVTKRDKSTYHMYSEIDHTTMILDEEPRGPSNQRVTEVNDKAVPSAPPQKDKPDIPVNENTYDMLHQKEQVQSKDDYSALDLRFVDLKDPRLNTYDVTSDIIGKSVSKEKTSDPSETDQQFVSEATVPKVEPTSGLTSDNITNISVHTDPKDNGGQYFVLEKVSDVTDTQNKVVQEHTVNPGSDNYFKLEPLA